MAVREIKTNPPVYKIGSIKTLENTLDPPNGTYEFAGALPIHVFWNNRFKDTTVVAFSAAVAKEVKTVPVFSGRRVTNGIPANLLLISDPSLQLDNDLNLGWYQGNYKQPALEKTIHSIIQAFVKNTRAIFIGGSGGGYAALVQNSLTPNSVAIAINPQTNIQKYPYFGIYLEKAWNIAPDDLPSITIRTSVLESYSRPLTSNVVYVQNTGDRIHVRDHWMPFKRSTNENNLFEYCDYFGDGHVSPPKDLIKHILRVVVKYNDWDKTTKELTNLKTFGPGRKAKIIHTIKELTRRV